MSITWCLLLRANKTAVANEDSIEYAALLEFPKTLVSEGIFF